MEYKIKALKVSSIRGYIVILEEYSLPEKYTTYRVHLHIPGIKQIFKDYPSTAISAADRYSNFNDDYKQILDTYADWVTEINNIDIDSDTISALEYPKYIDPDKSKIYIPNGYSLLRGTIEHEIEVTINECADSYEYVYSGTLKFANGDTYIFVYDYDTENAADMKDLLANNIFECHELDGTYIHYYDVFEKHGYNADTFDSVIEDILNEAVDAFREKNKENKNGSAT